MNTSVLLGVLLLSVFVYGGSLNYKLNKREIPRCYQINEEYTECGSACPKTCDSVLQTGPPVFCPAVCVPGCFCKQGYIRNRWGNCIPIEKCPCQGQDEVFTCGSACQLSCKNLNEICTNKTFDCIHACRCRDGFARDVSNQCISISNCSN